MPRRKSETAPLSEASRERWQQLSSIFMPANGKQMHRKGARVVSGLTSINSASPNKGQRRASALGRVRGVAERTATAEARERDIRKRLKDVNADYTQWFSTQQRQKAALALDAETLQRDVARVSYVMRASNRFILKPHGTFAQSLDVLTVACLVYTSTVTPYEIAFITGDSGVALRICDRIVLVVFSVGIVASFMMPFREPLWKGGKVVKDHKLIAKRYLT